MLAAKPQPSKSPRVTRHRRRRHGSFQSQHGITLKSDTQPLSSNKISPLKDDKISSFTTTDLHSHSSNKLSKRSTNITCSLGVSGVRQQPPVSYQLNRIPTVTNHPMNSNKSDSNWFDDRNLNMVRDYGQVFNWKKERKKRKNSSAFCDICTPLCTILSILAALLLATVITTVLIAVLIKKQSSTTIASISTMITATSTSSTSFVTSSTSFVTSSTSFVTSSTSVVTSSTSFVTSSTSVVTSSTSVVTSLTTASTSLGTTTTLIPCNFSCLNQAWISSSGLLAKWTFDGTFIDQMNTCNATAMNSPSFITNGYVNQALVFNATSNQYLETAYIPLVNASFTIELWLYPTGYPNPTDHSILGLCTYPGNDQCLHLTIRNFVGTYRFYMSFFGDNCAGNNAVLLNKWTHVAFVFNLIGNTMLIYQNGQIVGNSSSALPLQGTTNNVTIGYIPGIVAAYGSNYFQGYIDQLTIVNRAKSACEILDDATLATYYTFDDSSTLNDSGPNALLSTSISVSSVSSGHLSKAISFNVNTSYLQIGGLTSLGVVNKSFSISLWIRPYSLLGTLVFVSSTAAGPSWCIPFIGFGNNGAIVAQLWTGAIQTIYGPSNLTLSAWHHIVDTWSSTNGLRLYVDNVLVASNTSIVTYSASSASNYVTLANRPTNSCALGAVSLQSSFYGDIDDFRVYSRELNGDDVCALYHY